MALASDEFSVVLINGIGCIVCEQSWKSARPGPLLPESENPLAHHHSIICTATIIGGAIVMLDQEDYVPLLPGKYEVEETGEIVCIYCQLATQPTPVSFSKLQNIANDSLRLACKFDTSIRKQWEPLIAAFYQETCLNALCVKPAKVNK